MSAFGKEVRRLRLARAAGLRQFAKSVGMSPTYLSKVERGDFPPPAEAVVKAIARMLEQDSDRMMVLAGRIPSDVQAMLLSTHMLKVVRAVHKAQTRGREEA